MAKRTSISKATEAEVLRRSGRRCSFCVGLSGDTGIKQGQIAHIDRDASNNKLSNLAFLCLEHHDQYDSKTSQSKGFTEAELRSYRDQLYETLPTLVSTEKQPGHGSPPGNLPTDDGKTAPDDHERQIYTELWNSLFDFRIAAHNLVDPLQDRVHRDPQGKFIDTLNAYQAVVRRNEPFIVEQVFIPARAIVSHGREIVAATQDLKELQKQRDKCRDLAADEQIKEIDRLFDEVKNAIQNRTMRQPPLGSSD